MNSGTILGISLISGMVAFLISIRYVHPPIKPPLVVFAAQDLPIASPLAKEALTLRPMPSGANPKTFFTDPYDVTGKILLHGLSKGQPVRTMDLLEKSTGTIDGIPSGYRALPISVTLPANLTNLLHAGSRVDVILTYERSRGEIQSLTLAKSAKILSMPEPEKKPLGSGGNANLSLTIAGPSSAAETFAYAQKKGSLSLAIHADDEARAEESESFPSLEELFSKNTPPVVSLPLLMGDGIEIIRGLRKETYHFANTEKTNP